MGMTGAGQLQSRRHPWKHGASWLGAALAALAVGLATLAAIPVAAAAAPAAVRGALTVRVAGLPAGQQPQGLLRGPGLRRRVTSASLALASVRPGRYTLTLRRVKVVRGGGAVRPGATASASRSRVTVAVVRGRRARLTGVYDVVVNRVARADGRVLGASGSSDAPRAITLSGRSALRAGEIISLAPSEKLPRGLLARVRSARFAAGKTTVVLRAVSPFEVAPSFRFDVPLHEAPQAGAGAAGCGGASGLSPYRRIKNIRFSGGWNTRRILGQDVAIGVEAFVHFDVEAGVDVTGGVRVSCSQRATVVAANGMAGPIPVTASIAGELTASVGVGGKLRTGGSLHVDAGAQTAGLPPLMVWAPKVSFTSPRFSFSAERFAQASAGIGVDVEAGIGTSGVASATLSVGAKTELSAKPGSCSWDAHFGQFGARGKVLNWDVETPKTPPLFSTNLWRASCGSSGGGGGGSGGGGGGTPRPSPGPSGPPPSGTDNPVVDLAALSPTSGPGGMQVWVRHLGCPYALQVRSGSLSYGQLTTPDAGMTSLRTAITDYALPVGTHSLSVTCVDSRQRPVWHDPGFEVTIVTAPHDVMIASTDVQLGGDLTFLSGASEGPAPCPVWNGREPDSLLLQAYIPGAVDRSTSTMSLAVVNLPSGSQSETLALTGATVAGRYLVDQSCRYDADGRVDVVDYRSRWLDIPVG